MWAYSTKRAVRDNKTLNLQESKARAVVAAFRAAIEWVKSGGVLLITPDGPRGPNEVMAPGARSLVY